jgi:putative ABC transport system permease protein
MTFVFRMAWRETRASWARLLFFFLCVALGVGAIVVLRSLVENVRVTLVGEARELVGADLVIRSRQIWTPEIRQQIDGLLSSAEFLDRTEMVETQTMAASEAGARPGATRLVDIRAVGPGFPFYGSLELEDGRPYAHPLLAGRGVLVQRALLVELGLSVGDEVRLGGETFHITGVVVRDRVQREGLAFGPRVYVDVGDLRATSLLGFGSRATEAVLVRVDPAQIETVTRRLRNALTRDVASVQSWRSLEDRLGRNLTIAENHLSLVGFAVLVLGGIGVWSVTRIVVQQKIRSVAILKCLGATSRQVLATYVLLMLGLAGAGSLMGLGLAQLAMAFVPTSLLEPLGVTHVGLTVSAAVQGVAVGLLVALLFALVPLVEIRHVKPLLLLRADTATSARKADRYSWVSIGLVAAALVGVAMWQAGSWRTGLYVCGGLGAVGVALSIAGRLLVRAVRPLSRSPRFAIRHAVVSLGRPGNQTRVILLAVGLGCFFVLGVRAVQANLLDEFAVQVSGDAPDLILIDIQTDQVEGVRRVIDPFVSRPPALLPLMRARVTGVAGRLVNLPTREDLRREGRLLREYGVTSREGLAENERLVSGAFWTGALASATTPDGHDTEVSVEQDVAEQTRLGIGDVLRFDVAGRQLEAVVTSVRQVAWGETQSGGFVFVFRPGPAIDRTPKSFVGFVNLGEAPDAQGLLQRALVAEFPNVSVIDVGDVIASLAEIVENVTFAVTLVGAVTLVSGVLILVGAVALTKFQRLYEAAIYRTLGASTRLLATMVAIEYGVLGTLAGTLGAAGALGLSWAMSRGVFEIEWHPTPGLLIMGIAVTAVLVSVVGLVSSADVLVRKPLATLRRE